MPRIAVNRIQFNLGVAVVALFALAFAASPGVAQTGSFTLKISEKEMNLAHPNDMMWQKYIMWDLGYQRMVDRNMPYLELTNDPTSTAPISQFNLTIGDTRFHFDNSFMGNYVMLGSSTPGFNLSSSTLDGGNQLVVNIGNGGLAPGDVLRFKIDLGVDAPYLDEPFNFFPHPDYRTVLFDMNGVNVYDGNLVNKSTADNANAWVVFSPTSGPSFESDKFVFEDEDVVVGAQFFNNNYRRYGEMDPVYAFQLGGPTEGVIPEPSSLMLALVSLVGAASLSTRQRRGRQAG